MSETPNTSAREIAGLQRQLDELREIIETRDMEQVAIEGAVEYLLDQVDNLRRFVHMAAPGIIKWLISPSQEAGAWWSLMPRNDAPHVFPSYCTWKRPERRWAQFGTRQHLNEMCDAVGIKPTSSDRRHRESLVRRLWQFHQLPGSTHLHIAPPAEQKAAQKAAS